MKQPLSSIFLIFLALSCPALSMGASNASEEVPVPSGGVPGQILEQAGGRRIYFEYGVFIDWNGPNLALKDASSKNLLAVNLSSGIEKKSARQELGDQIVEQDLGGTLKKKAPLAYKNPVFRDVKVVRGNDDPLKSSGLQVTRVDEKTLPDGGKETITEYSDGSKSIVYQSPSLKEESSYNKKGDIVWLNLEGQEAGLKFKKTQWQDGSLIREYSMNDGILSVVHDADGNTQTFSFLKPDRSVLKEATCHAGICEAN